MGASDKQAARMRECANGALAAAVRAGSHRCKRCSRRTAATDDGQAIALPKLPAKRAQARTAKRIARKAGVSRFILLHAGGRAPKQPAELLLVIGAQVAARLRAKSDRSAGANLQGQSEEVWHAGGDCRHAPCRAAIDSSKAWPSLCRAPLGAASRRHWICCGGAPMQAMRLALRRDSAGHAPLRVSGPCATRTAREPTMCMVAAGWLRLSQTARRRDERPPIVTSGSERHRHQPRSERAAKLAWLSHPYLSHRRVL